VKGITRRGLINTHQERFIRDDEGSNMEKTLVIICIGLSRSVDCFSPFPRSFDVRGDFHVGE